MGSKISKVVRANFRKRTPKNVFAVAVYRDRLPIGRGLLTIGVDDVVLLLLQNADGHTKDKEIVWPIRGIRRYGAVDGVFSMESGRR